MCWTLLNKARRQIEKFLDYLYKICQTRLKKKLRSYRKKARKDYLKVAKKRRVSRKERRDTIFKQLQYIKRNLSHIDNLINSGAELSSLSPRKYKMLLVIAEVYRQQLKKLKNKQQMMKDSVILLKENSVKLKDVIALIVSCRSFPLHQKHLLQLSF